MRHRIICQAALIFLLPGFIPATAQQFYIVVPESVPVGNQTYRLSLDSCQLSLFDMSGRREKVIRAGGQ